MSRAWLGRLLRRVRAGEGELLDGEPRLAALPPRLSPTSPAFRDGGTIPARHAGRGVGANVSPALSWSEIPPEAAELALVMIVFGRNTWEPPGYAGPRALPGHGPHRCVFQLFALAEASGLPHGATPAAARRRIAAIAVARRPPSPPLVTWAAHVSCPTDFSSVDQASAPNFSLHSA